MALIHPDEGDSLMTKLEIIFDVPHDSAIPLTVNLFAFRRTFKWPVAFSSSVRICPVTSLQRGRAAVPGQCRENWD